MRRADDEGRRAPVEGSLEKTVGGIKSAGGEATAVAVDISRRTSASGCSQKPRAAYGPVDVLVNNAALTYFIPVKDYPDQPLDAVVGGELSRRRSC